MMKIRVGIIFGGQSPEHEISLLSARNVVNAFPREKYTPVLIGIGRDGHWFWQDKVGNEISKERPLDYKDISKNVDVVFPLVHGIKGEDGALQGFLQMLNIACVGASLLGSGIGMDKDITKRLLRESGVAVADGMILRTHEHFYAREIAEKWGLPLFVKPANSGSSIGISRVDSIAELKEAIKKAFRFDQKILLEVLVSGREIECSVLGKHGNFESSLAGEIIAPRDFYDFEEKYSANSETRTVVPATLTEVDMKNVRENAQKVCEILELEGMARVDIFLTATGKIVVNEVNTIPGFTNISMYPQMWEKTGLSYANLIDRLLQLALERFGEEKKRVKNFSFL